LVTVSVPGESSTLAMSPEALVEIQQPDKENKNRFALIEAFLCDYKAIENSAIKSLNYD